MNYWLILVTIHIFSIKADLAVAIFEKMLCPFTSLLFVFSSVPNCLSAWVAMEEKSEKLIPEEPLLFKHFCFQTVAAPTFAASFLTHICSPSSIWWTTWLHVTRVRTSFLSFHWLRLIFHQLILGYCTLVRLILRDRI